MEVCGTVLGSCQCISDHCWNNAIRQGVLLTSQDHRSIEPPHILCYNTELMWSLKDDLFLMCVLMLRALALKNSFFKPLEKSTCHSGVILSIQPTIISMGNI